MSNVIRLHPQPGMPPRTAEAIAKRRVTGWQVTASRLHSDARLLCSLGDIEQAANLQILIQDIERKIEKLRGEG